MYANKFYRMLKLPRAAQCLQLKRYYSILVRQPIFLDYSYNQTSHYLPKQSIFISSNQSSKSWIKLEKRPEYTLTFDQFKKVVEKDEVYVIDVREPSEVAEGRVSSKRYVNVPIGVISKSLNLPEEDFEAKFGSPKPSMNEPVVFMCQGGVRSTFALQNAQASGFKNSKHYSGGWKEWSKYQGKS